MLEGLGIGPATRPDVDDVAHRLGVEIERVPLAGARAQLVIRKRRARILLSERTTCSAEREFAIAHELGHLVLDHAAPPVSALIAPPSQPAEADERDVELEANCFALGLLMPGGAVRVMETDDLAAFRATGRGAASAAVDDVLTATASAATWAARADVRCMTARAQRQRAHGGSLLRGQLEQHSAYHALGTTTASSSNWSPLIESGGVAANGPALEHVLPTTAGGTMGLLWMPFGDSLRLRAYLLDDAARCRSATSCRTSSVGADFARGPAS